MRKTLTRGSSGVRVCVAIGSERVRASVISPFVGRRQITAGLVDGVHRGTVVVNRKIGHPPPDRGPAKPQILTNLPLKLTSCDPMTFSDRLWT